MSKFDFKLTEAQLSTLLRITEACEERPDGSLFLSDIYPPRARLSELGLIDAPGGLRDRWRGGCNPWVLTDKGKQYLVRIGRPFQLRWEERKNQEEAAEKEMLNRGLSTHRFRDNPEEQLFAEAWDAHNNSSTRGYLAYLLTTGDQRFPVEPTERDRQVAATVIQWLGSPVGRGFLEDLGYTKKE